VRLKFIHLLAALVGLLGLDSREIAMLAAASLTAEFDSREIAMLAGEDRGLENLCLSCNKIIIVPTKCRKCDESLVCSACITCGKCKQEIAEVAQRLEASRDAMQASQE
jgi:hypothetical protein